MKQGWKMVRLGEILKQYRITIWVDDTKQYNQLTNSKHSGIKARGYKMGSEIGRKRQFVVDLDRHPNTILFTRQTIQQDEAIGLCPYEVNGCIVTENMPLFAVENADPNFVEHYFKTEIFLRQLHLTAAIGTSQQSILEETFLNFEIPLPPLPEQQRIAGRLAALKEKIDAVRRLRGAQEKEMKGLLLMRYQKVIEGADWKPMKEVAPLMRRKVDLQPNTVYSEIGVRSFGKGIFEKPSFNSDELSWEKPNWIEEGDLLMSNIKAWEGAVAAVGKEHDGKVGSHRYLTFVPNPEMTSAKFLAFYFLTEAGNLKLSEASPGSADRNRTLNTKIILNTLVPVPDPELQKEFLQLQTKIDALKAAQAGQLSALEGLFPGVLERAFRGVLERAFRGEW